jgi:TM2 domain-containing membrane protein YozV
MPTGEIRVAKSRGVAAILQLLIPGAGYMYYGNLLSGIAAFLLTAVGYVFFIVPGVILHFLIIISVLTYNTETVMRVKLDGKETDL